MTRQPAGSFLSRLERSDDGARGGTVSSVQTGDRTDLIDLAELARILERSPAARPTAPGKGPL
ncbi:MAG: hypothetical protein ACRDGT_07920 [Candidatus Limnocylindria bacterium]